MKTDLFDRLVLGLFIIVLTFMLMVINYKIDERVDVHWILPRHADCAVKLMYLKDKDGKQIPSSRMVCHWKHGSGEVKDGK